MSNTVQLRVDTKTKRAVTHIFKSLGLDMSTGVKIYFQQVLKTKGIPFPLLTESGYTTAQEKKLLAIKKRTEMDYASGRAKGFSSVAAMKKDILSA